MSVPKVTESFRTESRQERVGLTVSGFPEHFTPRGRSPIAVEGIVLEFGLPRTDGTGGYHLNVELRGMPTKPTADQDRRWTDTDGNQRGYIASTFRRIRGGELDGQPEWLLALIEKHRPAAWLGEVPGFPRTLAGERR